MNIELIIGILNIVLISTTPLVFAGIGELVTEKSGVLNLGLEGLMLMGAVSGFIVLVLTGNYFFSFFAIIILLFASYYLQNFRIDASSDTLVAQNDEEFKYFNFYNKIFTSENFLVLAVEKKGEIDLDLNLYRNDINDFIFAKEAPDPYNLLVLRSSAGSSFGINYSRINDTNLEMLCDHEILTAVAHNGTNIKRIKIKKSKNAFVFGHESKGVPKRWLKESKKVTIKTKNIESLSVSSAAAIIINQILD